MTLLSRTSVVASSATIALGSLWPSQGALAQQSARTYYKPVAELIEPYSGVRGVRELADGRVIVTDTRDKVVQLADFKTGRASTIGREGSGPNEYQMPVFAFALPGDSTMIADPMNSRFLLLGPGGRLAGTWIPAAGAAPAPAPRPAAGGPAFAVGGAGGPMALLQARAVDSQGRLYTTGSPIVAGPDGPRQADSVPLTRINRKSMAADTIAWLKLPKGAATATSSGNNVSIRIGGGPFSAQDGWSVLPDGRVVVVRHANYQVEVYPASGAGAPVRGAPVKVTPIRVGEAEKDAYRESMRSNAPIGMAVTQQSGSGGATVTRREAVSIPQNEPTEWPAVLPAFQYTQVHALPNGQIWVGRYRAASDKNPRFDVFDATGKHTGQVVFPPRTNVIGFGKGVVYTVRIDDDDLQYLQRYALQ